MVTIFFGRARSNIGQRRHRQTFKGRLLNRLEATNRPSVICLEIPFVSLSRKLEVTRLCFALVQPRNSCLPRDCEYCVFGF